MPKPKRRVYEATDADLEQAGARGAQALLDRVEDNLEVLNQIELLGRLQAGLICLKDICTLYGVTKNTVYNWPLEPADTPTQQNLYRVENIADQLVDS
jgi:hypothetical protein